jgi:UPF0755 protein
MRSKLIIIIFGTAILTLVIGLPVAYFAYKISRPKPVPVTQVPDKKITIIEGWSNTEIQKYLERQLGISSTQFKEANQSFSSDEFSFLASKPVKASLEGFLFPDTYLVFPDSTAEEVFTKMLENFGKKLVKAQGELQPNSSGRFTIESYPGLVINGKPGISLYELIILASIIEGETGRDVSAGNLDSRQRLDAERKVVAGIFYNRLLIGQALQSDATVNYATGKSEAAPSLTDTQTPSLYNTYLHAGLPPGPIANPSLSSLIAVFSPVKTEYYYFLHKQPSGEVVYSKTFAEHTINKQKYLK